jgi:hypothetical protein
MAALPRFTSDGADHEADEELPGTDRSAGDAAREK